MCEQRKESEIPAMKRLGEFSLHYMREQEVSLRTENEDNLKYRNVSGVAFGQPQPRIYDFVRNERMELEA